LWILLSRLWAGWTDAISVVQPATVIRWQRTGFKLFWAWKSRWTGPGRPAVWTARQIVEAFPDDSAPRFLLRDRDATYGAEFVRRVKGMGIHEVLTAPRAPWQNPFVERVIGSIRGECLNHFVILQPRRHAYRRTSCWRPV
jgi:hypothetical protein